MQEGQAGLARAASRDASAGPKGDRRRFYFRNSAALAVDPARGTRRICGKCEPRRAYNASRCTCRSDRRDCAGMRISTRGTETCIIEKCARQTTGAAYNARRCLFKAKIPL